MTKAKRQKVGGRAKGTPNKVTKAVKEALIESFDEVGGKDYLINMAREYPVAYMSLLGKIIPTEMKSTVEGGISVTITTGVPLEDGK